MNGGCLQLHLPRISSFALPIYFSVVFFDTEMPFCSIVLDLFANVRYFGNEFRFPSIEFNVVFEDRLANFFFLFFFFI